MFDCDFAFMIDDIGCALSSLSTYVLSATANMCGGSTELSWMYFCAIAGE